MKESNYTIIVCLYCSKEHQVLKKEIERGNGKYCSRSCSARHYGQKVKESLELNETCALCNKQIHVKNKRASQSKHKVFFCCREHKDLALRKESNVAAALPTHYKNNYFSDYRLVYMRAKQIKSCETCGYDKYPNILEVHHKDRDRNNNSFDNLIALCPTCHAEEHYLAKDGKWTKVRLTSRTQD